MIGLHAKIIGIATVAVFWLATGIVAQPAVPQGVVVPELTDDFEAPSWSFNQTTGVSSNGKWTGAGLQRGYPETVQRQAVPAGAKAGSTHGMLLQTVDQNDNVPNQDDLRFAFYENRRAGGIRRADRPSLVACVYLPPFDEWNPSLRPQSGYQFGFRMEAYHNSEPTSYYYPSWWIGLESPGQPYLYARDGSSNDWIVMPVSQAGWWTLGISFDDAGKAYWYASPGTDDLTASDLRMEQQSSYRMERIKYHFFSLGKEPSLTPTTPFIVDDVTMRIVPEPASMGFIFIGFAAAILARPAHAFRFVRAGHVTRHW